jgi:hypothetical protein
VLPNSAAGVFALETDRPSDVTLWHGETVAIERWFPTLGEALDDAAAPESAAKAYLVAIRGMGAPQDVIARRLELCPGSDTTIADADVFSTTIARDGIPHNRGGCKARVIRAIGRLARDFTRPEDAPFADLVPGERIALEPRAGATYRGVFAERNGYAIRMRCDGDPEGRLCEFRYDLFPTLYRIPEKR